MGGSSCIVIGFNFATQLGCTSARPRCGIACTNAAATGLCASTLTLIVVGVLVLVIAAFYEVRTKRDALFPPIAFKDRTIGECPSRRDAKTLLIIVAQ